MMRPLLPAVLLSVSMSPFVEASEKMPVINRTSFEFAEDSEAIATVRASCSDCDWARPGHEAAVLRLELDGRYSQHLILMRGAETAAYRVMLGSLQAGAHTLTLSHDNGVWSKAPRTAAVLQVDIEGRAANSPEHRATELAPILHVRPNAVGRFSDVPLMMWYETDRTERGSRIRYSVIFSNEDGGTPADRLLATWGRLTDIEYVYGVEIDREGRILEETFQGKDHEIVPFKGRREGRHPLLYVITDNNMVKDDGDTEERFAPAPIAFDLSGSSREEIMDQHPWTYAVTAQEARREGRVMSSPTPGSKRIFDPRRYAVVEMCTAADDTTFATFTFALGVAAGSGPERLFESTFGVPEFRISRSPDNFPNSCFRGAVALPEGTVGADLSSLRVRAHARPPRKGEAPRQPGPKNAHLRRVNKIFLMDPADRPQRSSFSWAGEVGLPLDGEAATLKIKAPAAQK
jgi:hypothetical protein